MKKVICVLAIIGVFCVAPMAAVACDYPEQWQWADLGWSFEFGDNYMGGKLGHEMGQAMRAKAGVIMQQNQSAYGNFRLEMDGLEIDLRSSGYQFQASPPRHRHRP